MYGCGDVGVKTGFNGFDEYLKSNNKFNMTIKSASPIKSQKSKEAMVYPKMQEKIESYEVEKREATYTDPRSNS